MKTIEFVKMGLPVVPMLMKIVEEIFGDDVIVFIELGNNPLYIQSLYKKV